MWVNDVARASHAYLATDLFESSALRMSQYATAAIVSLLFAAVSLPVPPCDSAQCVRFLDANTEVAYPRLVRYYAAFVAVAVYKRHYHASCYCYHHPLVRPLHPVVVDPLLWRSCYWLQR